MQSADYDFFVLMGRQGEINDVKETMASLIAELVGFLYLHIKIRFCKFSFFSKSGFAFRTYFLSLQSFQIAPGAIEIEFPLFTIPFLPHEINKIYLISSSRRVLKMSYLLERRIRF